MPGSYKFNPSHLLPWSAIHEQIAAKAKANSGDKPPTLAIIASCGAFNPLTTAHIRMLESGRSYLNGLVADDERGLYGTEGPTPSANTICLGGFISPVNDAYGKADLAPFAARKAVCELALKDHQWVGVDDWEGTRDQYERTFTVLSHIRREVRAHYAATAANDDDKLLANAIECYFLCGGDLFETFYRSGVWDLNLLEKIFLEFRLLVVARVGSRDPLDTLAANAEPLTHPSTPDASLDLRLYRDRVHVIRIPNNTTSSTRVREALRDGKDLDGMVNDVAAKYLRDHKMYQA